MNESVNRFERLIDRINIVYGLVIPVGLMTIAATLLWLFNPTYFQPNSFWVWLVVIVSTSIVFLAHYTYVNKLKRPQVKLLYFYYHLALMTFCIFVAPYLSPYDFLWVILAIGMDLLFGRKWLILTFVLYITTLAANAINSSIAYDTDVLLRTMVQIAGAIGTTLLVSKFREVSDHERITLDKTTHDIALARQRLLALINNMGEAVIATDRNGKVLIYNAVTLSLFNTNKSLDNVHIDTILNLKDENDTKVNLFDLIKDLETNFTSNNYSHHFSTNDEINLYINASPIRLGYKAKSGDGFIIIIRDITQEKSLDEERDEFISVVSHELRTPIAVAEGDISNASFFAKKENAKSTIKSSLKQAHKQILFLADMINDLSTLSRAERNSFTTETEEIDVKNFIGELQHEYEPGAKAKGLRLTSSADDNVKSIYTSHLYLHEILQNLITNAIKYTQKGSIHISVSMNASKRNITFSVKDTGIGLSKNDQEHIFDKFWRSEDYRTRESKGTGLGLYVTSKLIQKLDAKLSLTSTINKGSTFSVTLPLKLATQSKKD